MAAAKRGRHFGQVAQELGLVAGYQVLEALDRQRLFAQTGRGTQPIGVHLVELGYVTEPQVEEVLCELERHQNVPASTAGRTGLSPPPKRPRRFGEIALDLGIVTRPDIEYALELQQVTRFWGREARPIGLLLVGMGALSLGQVDRVLEVLSEERARFEATEADTQAIAVSAERIDAAYLPGAG